MTKHEISAWLAVTLLTLVLLVIWFVVISPRIVSGSTGNYLPPTCYGEIVVQGKTYITVGVKDHATNQIEWYCK